VAVGYVPIMHIVLYRLYYNVFFLLVEKFLWFDLFSVSIICEELIIVSLMT